MNKVDTLKEYVDIQLNVYRKELENNRCFKSLLEITGKNKRQKIQILELNKGVKNAKSEKYSGVQF